MYASRVPQCIDFADLKGRECDHGTHTSSTPASLTRLEWGTLVGTPADLDDRAPLDQGSVPVAALVFPRRDCRSGPAA